LDFGCGNSGLMNALRHRVAAIEGLEVNPAAAGRGRNAGFTVYDAIGSIPPGRTYDRILSNHVLEHIRDVCSTLEALRRHLAPGGRFVFKLPIDDVRDRRQRNWSETDVDHHLQTWTPRLFGNVLKEAGLAAVEMRVVSSAIDPRVFFLERFGLHRLAFRLIAVLGRRRQLFVLARRAPARDAP
jgi:SAM-dependent methyltransferase